MIIDEDTPYGLEEGAWIELEEQEQCFAIPAASMRGHRTGRDRDCGAMTRRAVCHAGLPMALCRIHEAMWKRATDDVSRRELAGRWEW